MSVSRPRFELALKNLKPSDWEHFERLSSAFLASEWPGLRTMASPGGDGGRDAELFSPEESPHIAVQYSVQSDWAQKIRATARRLRASGTAINVLTFLSNHVIGAAADTVRKEIQSQGIFLDVRDLSWFVERANMDSNRSEAAEELCRIIVEPLLSPHVSRPSSTRPLSGQEAKTALTFLELQWVNETKSKNLTRSSFEALVRGALNGTSASNRLSRAEIHERVATMLPGHERSRLIQPIDSALHRLARSAVKHWLKQDEFHLSHEETERLKDVSAQIQLLQDGFESDLRDIISSSYSMPRAVEDEVIILTRRIIENYFLKNGEAFAASLADDTRSVPDQADLKTLAIEQAPGKPLIQGHNNAELLLRTSTSILTDPSEAAQAYLQLLADSYTLFAFLEETPDVQSITGKLFNQANVWLDTTVLLPVFAEQAYPDNLRPFTAMFQQAKKARINLVVSRGVIEEIERHINKCLVFTRTSRWKGDVPYVIGRYILAGGSQAGFQSWVEQFCGQHNPEQDISDYLVEEFGVEIYKGDRLPVLDQDVVDGIREYWRIVQDRRRRNGEADVEFNMAANRLAEHDSESYLSVLGERQRDRGTAPLGFTSWWLTMDRQRVEGAVDSEVWRKIKYSPVLSIDFLVKYFAFGPNRGQVSSQVGSVARVFAAPILETVPRDVLEAASQVRADCSGLSERIIQRRIRDALNRERMRAGPLQRAGLGGMAGVMEEMF